MTFWTNSLEVTWEVTNCKSRVFRSAATRFWKQDWTVSFSGFSVGFCIIELAVTNFSSENNLLTFRLNAPVIIKAKIKEVRTNVAIYIAMHYWGYTALEVKGRWGLLLPPCLLITAVQQPESSSPPSWLRRFSEGVIWMCRASFIHCFSTRDN